MTIIEAESTLTGHHQATIPGPVRKALGLHPHDRVIFRVMDDGKVHLAKAETPESDDPALAAFLVLLDARMAQQPQSIAPYTEADAEDDLILVEGVALD